MAESSILLGETDITTKLQSLLGQAWSSQHFGCSTPPGVFIFWTPKVIKLSFFIREDRVSCELLGVSLQDQRVARRLGPWQFQLFFYRAVWTWVHQKRHSRKTFGASRHIILVPHQICKGMINPKNDDTPSNLWYPGLLSDPYRDEMRDDSWRMAEFESSSKLALASLKATGERKQSRSRLQVAHWEGRMGKTLQEGLQVETWNFKARRCGPWKPLEAWPILQVDVCWWGPSNTPNLWWPVLRSEAPWRLWELISGDPAPARQALKFDLPSATQTWQWEIVYKYGSFHGEFLYNSCINGGFSIATFDYWKVMMFNGSSQKLKCSTPWQVLYHLQPPSSQLANWEMFNSIVKLLSWKKDKCPDFCDPQFLSGPWVRFASIWVCTHNRICYN